MNAGQPKNTKSDVSEAVREQKKGYHKGCFGNHKPEHYPAPYKTENELRRINKLRRAAGFNPV